MKYIFSLISMCIIMTNAHAQTYYNLGDIIEINGHKAIVFELDDFGSHGKAMSVKALRGIDNPWCNNGKLSKHLPALTNREDGYSITKQIISYARSKNAISSFPAFAWCEKMGEDWYIPSVAELEAFVNFWLGNNNILEWDLDEENDIDDGVFYKTINNKLLDAGGSAFINGVYTSTVDKDGKVYVFQFDRKKNSWKFNLKSKTGLGEDCVGRAFIKF